MRAERFSAGTNSQTHDVLSNRHQGNVKTRDVRRFQRDQIKLIKNDFIVQKCLSWRNAGVNEAGKSINSNKLSTETHLLE